VTRAAPGASLDDRGEPEPYSRRSSHDLGTERHSRANILDCPTVDLSGGCEHVVRGESADDVLKKAGEHARARVEFGTLRQN
jgi:hypothetical protein